MVYLEEDMNIKEIIIGYFMAKLIWWLFLIGVAGILGIVWLILCYLDKKNII